jgi:hypothetical protein
MQDEKLSVPQRIFSIKNTSMDKTGGIQPGDFVTYVPTYGEKERGRVKSLNASGTGAFVVYHCNNEWDRYQHYTAALTDITDLKKGWE